MTTYKNIFSWVIIRDFNCYVDDDDNDDDDNDIKLWIQYDMLCLVDTGGDNDSNNIQWRKI